ncbi:MAG: ATP-binding protein [Candidatus Limnocylindrales bacterium]
MDRQVRQRQHQVQRAGRRSEGQHLTVTCPACGEENPERFRLCGFCGTPLAAALPAQEVRKTVTIVFSDLKGSTSLGEALDSESLRELISRYFEVMRAELERHGGTIEKYIGDAVMAVFGMPAVHEDDALRAVRAAMGMQHALARLNDELERSWGVRLTNRTGVNTGEIVAGDPSKGQHLVIGDPVNTAARLEQVAPANEILIGELTYRLVRDAVEAEPVEPLELKGKAERVPAYRLRGLRQRPVEQTRDETPMVGREAELSLLRETFHEIAQRRVPRIVTVVGDAGVGKSRLIREFLAGLDEDALVVRGRCLPYGEGITFWPLLEMIRAAAELEDEDPPEVARARLLDLIGEQEVADRLSAATGLVAAAFPLAELFWAVQRFVELLAQRRPTVLVIDDIHWAEETFLDLLEHLAEAHLNVPVMLLCTARHDLLESRPAWGAEPPAQLVRLEPLTAGDTASLVEARLGPLGRMAHLADRVVRAAEGNPLFVEQLLSMLIDDGALRFDEGRWRTADDLGEITVSPTIQALLGARLDRLAREERAVLEPASVIGLVFEEAAVRALAPEAVRPAVAQHLATLDRKQLAHPYQAAAAEQGATFRFHHLLIRDAAYQALLKRTRATLHEAFVTWMDGLNRERDRGLEFEEILGYHLEQAHRYLADLGPLDAHGRELGLQAAERLGAAGRRAYARGDIPATANLLRRAAALLPRGDPRRPALLTEAGEALTMAGELAAAEELLGGARLEATDLGDAAQASTADLARLYLHYVLAGDVPEAEVVTQVEAAIAVLEPLAAHRGLCRAWRILTNVYFAGCRYLDAEAAAGHMIEHARLAGDRQMELRVLPALAICAQLGPNPVPNAIVEVETIHAALADDRRSAALTLRALAHLEAMRGRFDEARSLYRRSRDTLVELGWRFDAALTGASSAGAVELLAGDPVAAEAELRGDYEALAAMGERNYISTTAALLAEALYRQGRYDEAETFTRASEEVAAADDVVTQFEWRRVRGKVLAQRGQFVEAEAMVREALRIIGTAQDPDSQGNGSLDLAEVLALAGRPDDARDAAEAALGLFRQKDNSTSAARAQDFLDGLAPGR